MNFKIKGEYIKLGQVLKATGMVESGSEAKDVIGNGKVKVNENIEKRRGKKLYPGDVIEYNGEIVDIEG